MTEAAVRRRLLLVVDHRRNGELLEAWVRADATLELGEPSSFDLAVYDAPAFARGREWLRRTRAEQLPALLPCLLLTPHRRVSLLTADLWRDVDELITTPIRAGELRVRVERLLALRAQSLQLTRRLAEVDRSNVDLQQFAFVAAHELSTPLTVVNGAIQTVGARYADRLPDDAVDLLAAARLSSQRLQELIADLLAYSQAGAGVELGPVALERVVADALRPLQPELDATGARLEVDELPVVLGDPRQLLIVFSNLVGNALKYRRPGTPPRVEIRAEPADHLWCIHVGDNGIGVDPQRAEAVFDMFERAGADDDRPGSGIGLALCRRIVERHGGRIWIERRDGGGTVVRLTLPAA